MCHDPNQIASLMYTEVAKEEIFGVLNPMRHGRYALEVSFSSTDSPEIQSCYSFNIYITNLS